MQLLDLSSERLPIGNQMLSEEVEVQTTDTETIEFYGFDREAFGITRVIVSVFTDDTALRAQEESLVEITAKNRTGRRTVWEDVIAQSITDLFEYRALQVPLVIDQNQSIQFEISPNGGAGVPDTTTHTVDVTLIGMDEAQLNARRSTLREKIGFVPDRSFVYAPATEVPAGAEGFPVELITDSQDGFFRGFAASNAELAVNSQVNLESDNENLSPPTRLDVHREYILNMPSPYTYKYRSFAPLYAEFTNNAASAVRHSLLADSLYQEVLTELGGLPGTPA